MYQPEFHRNDDVWDDDEERTRGRDPFPMAVDDITGIDGNDVRLGYHVNVIRNRPDTIQGSVNGSLDFLHGGVSEFDQFVNVMVLSGAAGDPAIARPRTSHPLQQGFDILDPFEIKLESTGLGDLDKQLAMVIEPTERVMKMISEDSATALSFNILKSTLQAREVHDWCLLVLMIAAKHPLPDDKRRLLLSRKNFTKNFGFVHPEPLSVRRAALMIIGPRGFVHGWGGSLPYLRRQVLDQPQMKYLGTPEWGPADTMTDSGNSSYKTDSSGAEDDNNDPDFGGPRGIVRLRPAVTGMTSDSSDSYENTDYLNMYSDDDCLINPKHRKLMKRFVKYVKTSNKERRERQAIRRERRMVRNKYESRRRLAEPLFDLEARRAQALAVEKKINEIIHKNKKDAREKDFKRAHQAIHDEVTSECDEVVVDSPQAQARYKQFLAMVRAKVIKRWMEQTDRRLLEQQHELDDEEEMRFHSWVSPVHWVKQTGPNCGLAVLAMAARPVMACEVAMDSSVGVNKNINSTINFDACSKQLKITKLRALTNDVHYLKTCCEITHPPLTIFPPGIMELQSEAVMNNYSSRGEMFSALAMSKLAYSYHVGQYKVHLINRGLWNEYENKQLKKQIKSNVTYEKYFGIKEFDNILLANYNDNDDKREQKMDINDVPLSSGINDNLPSMDQEMNDTKGNAAPPSLMQENEDFEEDFNLLNNNGKPMKNTFMRNPLKENTNITDDCGVTVSPHNSLWKMSVVKHLMSGNRIAVCYDCDKNMKPSLNNNGSTAHWAIMCGVIVGKVYQKKLYDNQEDGYMYYYEKDTHELKEMNSISRNDIIEGTANAGYLFDDPIRQIVIDHPLKIPHGGNIDVDEANYIKDCGMEYDDYCGDVDLYNNIMHNVDLNNVWVVVQHGKNVGDFDVWKLDQVAKSNQQLKLPSKKILSCFWSSYDDEDTRNVLLQSMCSASLFGTNYKTSFMNVKDSTNVLRNCDNNARQSLYLTLNQNQAGLPPPPPLPPTPSVIMPKKPRPYLPFILPEGVRLDNCLAQRFILFKPIRSPYFISNTTNTKLNLCPNQRKGGPQALDPVICFFTFDTLL